VKLEDQWHQIEDGLPEDWSTISLSLMIAEDDRADRAALILAPFTPGRRSSWFRFQVRRGQDPARVLQRLDDQGIRGLLDVVETQTVPPPKPVEVERKRPVAEQWVELEGKLPPDWSDVYAEVELHSTDFIQRGALLLSPLNPARHDGPTTLRFRVACTAGYGTAPEMARRCFERLDEEHITGTLRFLRVLSATNSVSTQGPVWRLAGRSV
jgi:hypothetical protein